MRCGLQDSSRVAAGNSGFLSSCDRNLGEPPELPKGSQASFQVVRGNLAITLESLQGNLASSRIEWGDVVFFPELRQEARVPLELRQGPQGTSCVA